ncbi:MAG: channel protein TolC, partial [Azoarcus sp.]|nr:channel protein TolC [Azoarcus sp.]
ARYDGLTAEARTLSGMGHLMRALDVAREDLPSAIDAGQDRDGIDPATMCPPDAPASLQIDKAALLAKTLKEMGVAK